MTIRRQVVVFPLAAVTLCLLSSACRPTHKGSRCESPAWARTGFCSQGHLPYPIRPVIVALHTKERAPQAVLDRVRALLPKGWKLKVSGNAAVAERRAKVQLYLPREGGPDAPAGKGRNLSKRGLRFRISLFFSRKLSPGERVQKKKQQAALVKRLQGIVQRLAPPGKYFCVRPHRSNKKLFDRLVRLTCKVERVPRYYSPHRSVHIFDSREHWSLRIRDQKVRDECNAVLGKIQALFKRYP